MTFASPIRASERPDFLFLGGHPAIDFANTLVPPPGLDVEFLQSWQDVTDWLEAAHLSGGGNLHVLPSEAAGALRTVRNLRNRWKRTLEEIRAGRGVRPSFTEELNVLLRLDDFHDVLHAEGKKGFHLHRSPSRLKGPDLALAILARMMAEFLATAEFEYLRRCANTDSCVLSFYDTTKNHRRQWCSNAT